MQKGGFRLCKFTANRKEVIESIAKEDRVKDIKNIDLDKESLPPERILGVEWNIRNDSLKFHIMHTQGQTINKKRHFVYSKFDL